MRLDGQSQASERTLRRAAGLQRTAQSLWPSAGRKRLQVLQSRRIDHEMQLIPRAAECAIRTGCRGADPQIRVEAGNPILHEAPRHPARHSHVPVARCRRDDDRPVHHGRRLQLALGIDGRVQACRGKVAEARRVECPRRRAYLVGARAGPVEPAAAVKFSALRAHAEAREIHDGAGDLRPCLECHAFLREARVDFLHALGKIRVDAARQARFGQLSMQGGEIELAHLERPFTAGRARRAGGKMQRPVAGNPRAVAQHAVEAAQIDRVGGQGEVRPQ